ncbi:hypothetical protein [Selenomonas ruminantium]|nr:hypothetical protein [Selenomonas ruminantium]
MAIISLMAGEQRKIDTANFANDMTTFHSMDDVLTLFSCPSPSMLICQP